MANHFENSGVAAPNAEQLGVSQETYAKLQSEAHDFNTALSKENSINWGSLGVSGNYEHHISAAEESVCRLMDSAHQRSAPEAIALLSLAKHENHQMAETNEAMPLLNFSFNANNQVQKLQLEFPTEAGRGWINRVIDMNPYDNCRK